MRYFVLFFASLPLFADVYSESPWSPDANFVARGIVGDDVLELTNQTFDEFIQQDLAVVKFFADWCGPCKRFASTFTAVARELSDVADFARLNISTAAPTTSKCNVKAVPAVIIYSHGTELKRHRGSLTEEKLKEFILSAVNDR